jgi:septal ring factor EnvC (AmiA/AmiB activator)
MTTTTPDATSEATVAIGHLSQRLATLQSYSRQLATQLDRLRNEIAEVEYNLARCAGGIYEIEQLLPKPAATTEPT